MYWRIENNNYIRIVYREREKEREYKKFCLEKAGLREVERGL